MAMTLLIGGARSGKSALAGELAKKWGGPVTFIATGAVFLLVFREVRGEVSPYGLLAQGSN